MKKRKIVYVGNNLRGEKTNVTTIETLSEQLRGLGYEVVTTSSKKQKALRMLDMLFTVFKHRKSTSTVLIDTYSTQNFYYAVGVGNVCRLFNIPYVPILHGGNLPQRLQKSKALSYKLFKGAKTNVAPSAYLQQEFLSQGYNNITYIPNTIKIEDYPFLERKNLTPRLLWVRSFAEIYNPLMALKALAQLKPDFPEIELCMIGPDKDGSLEKCKTYAKENNLPVKFTGRLTKEAWREVAKEYDIFLNTTHFDNTPVSVIEAMALGLPVISTHVGGIPYLIEDDKEGKLIPPDNVEALTTCIKELLKAPDLALRLANNARVKAEGFDWKKVKLEWTELLKE